MFKTNSVLKKWHVIGTFWIIIVGSLLHFTYEWSNNSTIVGYFSAVNESVWEHLKLGYSALTFFILIDYWPLRNKTTGYFAAKAGGIISMNLLIALINHIYVTITNNHNLIFHIILFILAAIVCQLVSFYIMKSSVTKIVNLIGLVIYVAIGVLFVILTPYEIESFVPLAKFFYQNKGKEMLMSNII